MILGKLETNIENNEVENLIEMLNGTGKLTLDQYEYLLNNISKVHLDKLFLYARQNRDKYYGNNVFIRGLVEFSNVCFSDCYYCGIRHSADVERYRLDYESMFNVVDEYYQQGYRSFVFQSGENPHEDINGMVAFIKKVKASFSPIAVTLSIGEKTTKEYQQLHAAGMDRFLLRHETACEQHYQLLHPSDKQLQNRLACAQVLKDLGVQLGLGLMVNSPYQTNKSLAMDLILLSKMNPQMIGIGPYLKSNTGYFKNFESGTALQTTVILALVRLTCKTALLPSTTALGLCDPNGRQMGLNAGCNVVMINLTPQTYRKDYMLYNKNENVVAEIQKNTQAIVNDIESCGLVANFLVGHHCQKEE